MAGQGKPKRFKKVTVIGQHRDIERDVEVAARKGQPGITKEDVRQIARLGYRAVVKDGVERGPINSRQTVVKRIRQWKMGLGCAFLTRRPVDETSALLGTTDIALEPRKAQLEEISLAKGSKTDPNSIVIGVTQFIFLEAESKATWLDYANLSGLKPASRKVFKPNCVSPKLIN